MHTTKNDPYVCCVVFHSCARLLLILRYDYILSLVSFPFHISLSFFLIRFSQFAIPFQSFQMSSAIELKRGKSKREKDHTCAQEIERKIQWLNNKRLSYVKRDHWPINRFNREKKHEWRQSSCTALFFTRYNLPFFHFGRQKEMHSHLLLSRISRIILVIYFKLPKPSSNQTIWNWNWSWILFSSKIVANFN